MAYDPRIVQAVETAWIGWQLASAKLSMFATEMENCVQRRIDDIVRAGRMAGIAGPDVDDTLTAEGLPTLCRDAMFLVVFGVYEHHVAGLCSRIVRNYAPQGERPKGTHLHHSQEFLIKIGFPPAAFDAAWNYLDHVRLVRNHLAHEAATVDPSDGSTRAEQIREFVRQAAHIELDNDRLTLDASFVPELIERMGGVFKRFREHVH